MQSFGLLNQFLPSSSILDKGLPISHFWLLYIFSNIILPVCLWSSCWPSWNGFPGVYCFDHSWFLHPFNVTKPSKSLCSNEVYYILVFYYLIQFLVGFYSPNTIFIGWDLPRLNMKYNGPSIVERFDYRTAWNLNKKFEKNSVCNSNKNSKVEPWAWDCTASCGSCHRELTNKNVASGVLLVGLRISTSSSPIISV